jgi:hypothetical protein
MKKYMKLFWGLMIGAFTGFAVTQISNRLIGISVFVICLTLVIVNPTSKISHYLAKINRGRKQ